MFFRYITITGVDTKTDINRLISLSSKYPNVEWGFLYSFWNEGKEPRYMSVDDIIKFATLLVQAECNTSLHLCGQAFRDFVDFPVLQGSLELFNRVQLNFNASAKNMPALCDLTEAILAWPDTQFIIQYNDNNKYLWRVLYDIPNLALLCDASGGRGKEIDTFEIPATGIFTGYAGGIGPNNIKQIKNDLADIQGVGWLDMESNVRTNDWLDLNKVEAVLSA